VLPARPTTKFLFVDLDSLQPTGRSPEEWVNDLHRLQVLNPHLTVIVLSYNLQPPVFAALVNFGIHHAPTLTLDLLNDLLTPPTFEPNEALIAA
jgi:hypothetical protein